MDEEDIRSKAERRLGRRIHPAIWQHLVEESWPDQIRQDVERGGSFTRLMDEFVRAIRRLETTTAEASKRNAQASPKARQDIPPDDRHRALTRILAIEAARLPGVSAFRRDELDGVLVKEEDVGEWLREHGDTEQIWHDPELGLFWHPPGEGPVIVTEGWNSGPLQRLRELAKKLSDQCSWTERGAVLFILAGRTPWLPLATVETYWRSDGEPRWLFPAQRTVRLEVNVRMSPREVAAIYSEARTEMAANDRDRAISEKHAELGVFAAERNDGRTWEEVMADWNRRCPQDAYADVRLFSRDCRQAYRRITGSALSWAGRRRGSGDHPVTPENLGPTHPKRGGSPGGQSNDSFASGAPW